jgi:hypothetical protein
MLRGAARIETGEGFSIGRRSPLADSLHKQLGRLQIACRSKPLACTFVAEASCSLADPLQRQPRSLQIGCRSKQYGEDFTDRPRPQLEIDCIRIVLIVLLFAP